MSWSFRMGWLDLLMASPLAVLTISSISSSTCEKVFCWTFSAASSTHNHVKHPQQFKREPSLFFSNNEIQSFGGEGVSFDKLWLRSSPMDVQLRRKFTKQFKLSQGKYSGQLTRYSTHSSSTWLEEDYLRLWLKGQRNLLGFPNRIFKWSLEFCITEESTIVLLWISLDNIPIHLFEKKYSFCHGFSFRKVTEDLWSYYLPFTSKCGSYLHWSRPIERASF